MDSFYNHLKGSRFLGCVRIFQFKKKLILLFFFGSVGFFRLSQYKQIVLFSPDDKIENHLIKEIDSAKNSIFAAVFMITNKKIANAISNAQKRGVAVQIITDAMNAESCYSKACLLEESGVEVFVFSPRISTKPKRFGGLMHNKFAIFDNKKLWTGSFNWTHSANWSNQENVILTTKKEVCEKFLVKFEQLRERSQRLKALKEQSVIESVRNKISNFFNFGGKAYFSRLHEIL